MRRLHCGIPALVMMVAAPSARAIDTAAELARAENTAREAVTVLMEPQRVLEAKFKAALEKAEEAARQSGDFAGELAAIKALQDLHDDRLGANKIDHSEVLRLSKVFIAREKSLVERFAPELLGVRTRYLADLAALEVKLGNAGQFQDSKRVRDFIVQVEDGKKELAWIADVESRIGTGFFEMPESMRARFDADRRLALIDAGGGDARGEEAVMKGLRWLKSTQNADGSWTGSSQCAMTGLALLVYLGHGESPLSEEFGDTVLKAITYLVAHGVKNNGLLASSGENNHKPYEHAIATHALAEAATICAVCRITIPNLREVVAMGGRLIISNQHESGGWDYGYSESSRRGGDLSVSSWQIGALAACRTSGIEFKNLEPCVKRALDYVEKRQGSDGGFGYSGKGDSHAPNRYHTLTGAGMLSLQQFGKTSAASVRKGAIYIRQNSKFHYNGPDCDLYGHYYESQAMRWRGGEQWQTYHAKVFDQLLVNQNDDGSWKAPGGGKEINAVAAAYTSNVHYRNCLCLLILEVYYRVVPERG